MFLTLKHLKENNTLQVTMYKKHRALVLTPKFCVYLQSPPNIKFDVFNKKDKSKILYLAKCLILNVVLILCPTCFIRNVSFH
ncbi:hypothetical protein AUW17_07685 [Tenacibaculum dicentrarchi]|nr:hypothetical protein AUW17_07685 [Tenacibaculum dicentrarchi]